MLGADMKNAIKHWSQIINLLLFIALCVSVAYWAIQLFKPQRRAVAAPPQIVQPATGLGTAANLFGGHPIVDVTHNFQLKGVVTASNPAESIAILAGNGSPARAISVNKEVAPGVTVKEVHNRHVLLLENGSVKRIDLPEDTRRR